MPPRVYDLVFAVVVEVVGGDGWGGRWCRMGGGSEVLLCWLLWWRKVVVVLVYRHLGSDDWGLLWR